MTTIDSTRPAPFGAITTYRTVQAVSGLFAALAAWNLARQTRNALWNLSDRELDDIGLTRGDIEAIAQGAQR